MKAGARLRSKANKVPAARSVLGVGETAVPDSRVGLMLGRDLTGQVADKAGKSFQDLVTEDLLRDAFSTLRSSFLAQTQDAQLAAIEAIGGEASNLPDSARDDALSAWDLFLAAMIALAAERIFTPFGPPEQGEFDPSTSVPQSIIRGAMSRAGGTITDITTETPLRGLANGPTVVDQLSLFGLEEEGFLWVYGDPGTRGTTFEPHRSLGGVEFTDFDDPRLANLAGVWPGVSHFHPGDHAFCQCSLQSVIVAVELQDVA